MSTRPTTANDRMTAEGKQDETPSHRRSFRSAPGAVPPAIRTGAAWTWRLLLFALAGYLLVELLSRLTLLVLPLFAALFFTALLQPLTHLLRRARLPRSLAAILTVLVAVLVLIAVGFFAVQRGIAAYPSLVDQASGLVRQLGDLLRRAPFGGAGGLQINQIQQQVLDYLTAHRTTLAQDAFTGVRLILEVAAASVLGVFFTLYFLYDGRGIWAWLVQRVPARHQERVGAAGQEAWRRVGGFVRGTFVIAAFHGIVVGTVLWLLGVPLLIPLALLVFFGSFIPIIGAVVFGGLALLVTLVSNGFVAALIFLVVLVVENQIEAHVLQPFLVGRYVRLHPVVIAVSIAGGGILAGVPGAIVAIPLVSAVYGAARVLRRTPSAVSASDATGQESVDNT